MPVEVKLCRDGASPRPADAALRARAIRIELAVCLGYVLSARSFKEEWIPCYPH